MNLRIEIAVATLVGDTDFVADFFVARFLEMVFTR